MLFMVFVSLHTYVCTYIFIWAIENKKGPKGDSTKFNQDLLVGSRKAKKKQHTQPSQHDYLCVIYSYQHCKISEHCNLVHLGNYHLVIIELVHSYNVESVNLR